MAGSPLFFFLTAPHSFEKKYPELVSRMIALDVGHLNIRESPLREKLFIVLYQLWLVLAFLVWAPIGNLMTRAFAAFMKAPRPRSEIFARMNYPYYHFWKRVLTGRPLMCDNNSACKPCTCGQPAAPKNAVENKESKTAIATASSSSSSSASTSSKKGAASVKSLPACPLLFVFGKKSPVRFHSPSFLQALGQRTDCSVAAFPTDHWLMVHKATELNEVIDAWMAAK